MAQAQKEFSVVGKTTPRMDAYERVTGQAQYTGDIQLPGMLYARVLRSPHPHARIVSIDPARAEKLPGVRAVIHHGNAQVPWSSGGALSSTIRCATSAMPWRRWRPRIDRLPKKLSR
jgi:CO/xanthine dehydrogenase Mo-binding subunit